jgi:SAM-dependent methyltransferase
MHDNYRYWQENGQGWFDEYARRKARIPYFHIQELVITELIARAAPTKVLEYGCGVGRHLRNLVRLPQVEAYGYDQSPTMVAEIARWTRDDFLSHRVTVGPPIGRLPYADGEFDIVFTCEVLVHTRHQDVAGILSELLRVSRGVVFHLEPDPTVDLVTQAHAGCWGHDLAALYRELGVEPIVLPRAFACQLPVLVERAGAGLRQQCSPLSPTSMELLLNMERELSAVIEPESQDEGKPIDWSRHGRLSILNSARSFSRRKLVEVTEHSLSALAQADRRMLLLRKEIAELCSQLEGGKEPCPPVIADLLAAREEDVDWCEQDMDTLQLEIEIDLERAMALVGELKERVAADQLSLQQARAIGAERASDPRRGFARLRRGRIRLEVLEPNPRSKGTEVWLRFARFRRDGSPMPWSRVSLTDGWSFVEARGCTGDMAIKGTHGAFELPDGASPVLNFMRHPWSGRIRVLWRGQQEVVDLFRTQTDEVNVDLAQLFSARWPAAQKPNA